MWTLTIDPQLFSGPEEALAYVREKRCISRLCRDLRKAGLIGEHYFFVLEFTQAGWPHWHLLVEATYVPFDVVCTIWNRFRPVWCGPVVDDRPGFGAVRFSAPIFRSAHHAGCYVTKYLIKTPRHGLPAWVLDTDKIVHRYSVSRGFWGRVNPVRGPVENPRPRVSKSNYEKVRACRERCVLLSVREVMDVHGEVKYVKRFVGLMARSYEEVCEYLGFTPRDDGRMPYGAFLPRSCLSDFSAWAGIMDDATRGENRFEFAFCSEELDYENVFSGM